MLHAILSEPIILTRRNLAIAVLVAFVAGYVVASLPALVVLTLVAVMYALASLVLADAVRVGAWQGVREIARAATSKTIVKP